MNELQQRFSNFLEKLLAKAEELTNEVKITIQETYDSDTDAYKRNFFNFKNWIEGQYRWIIKKAEDVFESQIKPKYLMTFEQSLQSSMQKKKEEFEWFVDLLENWKMKVEKFEELAFKDLKEKSVADDLNEILAEYEKVKDKFFCKNCWWKLELKEYYFISTYITCPFCKTQNIFNPSTKMRELELTVRDLAEEKASDLEKNYETVNSAWYFSAKEIFFAYFIYRATVYLEQIAIVPVFTETNKKIFFKELNDFVLYEFELENLASNKRLYEEILEYFSEVQQKANLENRKMKNLAIEYFEKIWNGKISDFEKYISELKKDYY